MKKHWKGNRSKEQSSKISNIFIWGIIIVLMILGMTSCGKKDEEVKPEQPPIVLRIQDSVVTEQANLKFIGVWENGFICGSQTSLSITEGHNDSTILIHGAIVANVNDSTFVGILGAVKHSGELQGDILKYCQESQGTLCCGYFTK